MKVIIVTDYAFINGGAGKVALESAVALCDHVESVHVFSSVGHPAAFLTEKPNLTVTTLDQEKVTDRKISKAIIAGLSNKEVASKFDQVLEEYDPKDTVIHIHSWRDSSTLSFMPCIYKRGFKFVFTGHDFGIACPTAGFYNHSTQQICTEKGLGLGCLSTSCTGGSFIKKNWFMVRHLIQVKHAKIPSQIKHFITVSALSERILKPYLPESVKIHRVHNPISTQRGPRVEAEKNRAFVFAGRYSPEKAPGLVAEATRRAGVEAMFIGTGALVDEIRVANPNAKMRGWREPHEVRELLREARCLIFPSVWYEVQGMVVDEAASLGVPVISSDVNAGADTVRRLGCGTTFHSGDIEALCRRIEEFRHDEVVHNYSVRGYENYWANPTDMARHLRELLAVYDSVLAD